MKTSLRLAAALFALLAILVAPPFAKAQSLVDTSSPMETITSEFAMCDGPAWDGNALWVPDVKGGKLYRFSPSSKKLTVGLADAGRISAVDFNLGRLYLSDNGEASIAKLVDGRKELVAKCAGGDKARPNDLVIDSRGGIYYTLTAAGSVVYLAPDGKQSVVADKIDTPNGLALSPDEHTLYVDSYVPKQLWAFPLSQPGTVGERRLLAAMDSGPDKGADGMTVDRAGNIYCTGPTHVWVWSPGGKLLTKIETPTRPINCVFGDRDMKSLYITGLGALYRQRMNITGVPAEPSLAAGDPVPLTKTPANNKGAADDEALSTALPPGVKAELNVVYAQYGDRKLLADIFTPSAGKSPRPALVIVHGGAWAMGDKTKFRALTLALAARGYVTAVVEYRLSGEARFPAAIQDCNAATRFLRANAGRYSIDPLRIGAVGGSAGGHLVGLMAAAPDTAELQGAGGNADQSSRLQATVVMAGPMELATGTIAERSRDGGEHTNTIDFLGHTINDYKSLYELASPYNHFSKKTPPILFMTGELDNPQRDAESLKKLKELGVWTEQKIYARGKHGCWMHHPWFEEMVADMDAFFQQHLRQAGVARGKPVWRALVTA